MKVKRLKDACCGMENGKTYEAEVNGSYIRVQLENGEWTSEHWNGEFNTEYFKIIESVDPESN